MLGTLVKEHESTQSCCWVIRPGLDVRQHKHPRTSDKSTWKFPEKNLHEPKPEATRTFCGTSGNSFIILDAVQPNQSQFEPLRAAPEPVLSVPDSWIFCICPSPAEVFFGALLRNREPCWVEP